MRDWINEERVFVPEVGSVFPVTSNTSMTAASNCISSLRPAESVVYLDYDAFAAAGARQEVRILRRQGE